MGKLLLSAGFVLSNMMTSWYKNLSPIMIFGIVAILGPMNCHERILFKPSHEQQNAN